MRADLRLLVTCAAAALACGEAHGQAFQATPTIVAGTVNIDRSVPAQDTITVSSASAIIDWRLTPKPPIPDPVVFLPAGSTGIFRSDVPGNNYAVLNRVIPIGANRILMDGKVMGQMLTAGGATAPGGTIVFYSPTGIIIGPNGSFDVGSLLLTALDPLLDPDGEFFVNGRFQLAGGQFPDAAIETQPGSVFTALQEGSFVAFAAPRILHGGLVDVNGAAAFVGAEAVQLTIDQGLFDIQILVGSQAANPIVHSGETGGPASQGAADPHGIYMAAVGQQQAISLLLSGSVGFAPAVSAAVENGAILLSAGHNVTNGRIDRSPAAGEPATIRITGGRWSSDVTAQARTEIFAGNAGTGELHFEQDARLFAFDRVTLSADAGWLTRVGGDALLSAANTEPVLFNDVADIAGGAARIFAGSGARVEIAGNATVDASAAGGVLGAEAGDGRGGTASVAADKGRVEIAGSLDLLAAGTGAAAGPAEGAGGAGAGGDASVSTPSGGVVTVQGSAIVAAPGTGGSAADAAASGGAGVGGAASVIAGGGGRIDLASASLSAAATGGNGGTGSPAAATGGAIEFSADGIGASLTVGTLAGTASATGGAPSRAGNWRVAALGGASVGIDDATLAATVTGAAPAGTGSTLAAEGGSTIRIVNAGNLATHGDIAIDMRGTGQLAGGALALDGRAGIAIAHAAPPAGRRTVDVTRFAATTVADYDAGPGTAVFGRDGVTIEAGGDATLGDTGTAADLLVTAGGTARLRGAALGGQVEISSRDIEVAGGARIGDAGTIRATLRILPSPQPATLGGAAQGPGYTLTQAEAARIRAGLVQVAAPGDIFVRDLALAGGGGPNGIDAFEVATPGLVRVEGNLVMANANAAGRIGLDAGRLEVATPGGSIRIRDAAGAPAGTLEVAAADIWVARDGLIAQLRADSDFAGRDQALRANDGADTPRGFVEAGRIRLAPAATLYVQNSGTAASYAGLTVGAGGLEIAPSGEQPASVYAFGRRLGPNGVTVTNFLFFREVDFNRAVPPRYTSDAEFNRCNINSGICRNEFTPVPGNSRPGTFGPFLLPPEGDSEDPLDEAAFLAEPLIEEPVTSGSDSTLWAGPDEDDDEDEEE